VGTNFGTGKLYYEKSGRDKCRKEMERITGNFRNFENQGRFFKTQRFVKWIYQSRNYRGVVSTIGREF